MTQEEYVSFETAKLLKEKGFNEKVICYYDDGGSLNLNKFVEFQCCNEGYGSGVFAAPTLQMAMKWLRETHKIIPIILTGEHSRNPLYYWFRIDTIIEGKLKDAIYREDEKEYSSYEQACEAALKYCLKNLI